MNPRIATYEAEPRVFCEWGLRGMELLRERVAVLIVVDVLSFSSAVDVAVGRGAAVIPFPCGNADAARAEATRRCALLAAPRSTSGTQLSLSPQSLRSLMPGQRILLPSPNGSRISLAGGAATVLAGSLRNRMAVAGHARELAAGAAVGVVPAGERWPDGSLRLAIEDLLGAGALIDALALPTSAEAEVARLAFQGAGDGLGKLVRASLSGQELIELDFAGDVELALALDASDAVPMLRDGAYTNARA